MRYTTLKERQEMLRIESLWRKDAPARKRAAKERQQNRQKNRYKRKPLQSFEEKAWAKFNKYTPVRDGCWEWRGSIGAGGYGRISVNKKGMPAHKLSYLLHRGVVAEGLCVCHRCDNPACVNPNHLFLGTQRDNLYDMWNKGRGNPQPKNYVPRSLQVYENTLNI